MDALINLIINMLWSYVPILYIGGIKYACLALITGWTNKNNNNLQTNLYDRTIIYTLDSHGPGGGRGIYHSILARPASSGIY